MDKPPKATADVQSPGHMHDRPCGVWPAFRPDATGPAPRRNRAGDDLSVRDVSLATYRPLLSGLGTSLSAPAGTVPGRSHQLARLVQVSFRDSPVTFRIKCQARRLA